MPTKNIGPNSVKKKDRCARTGLTFILIGRRVHSAVREKKQKEDDRVKNNPKIGETHEDHPDKKAAGCLTRHVRDKPAELAVDSTETLLKLFGKDGGAFLREAEPR